MKLQIENYIEIWNNGKLLKNEDLTEDELLQVNECIANGKECFNNGRGSFYIIKHKQKLSIEENVNINVNEKIKKKK